MSANAVAIRSPLKRKRITPLPYILLIPTMFFLVVFTFYPLVNCIRLTFYATDQIGRPGRTQNLEEGSRIG